jgi:hypothetical protein
MHYKITIFGASAPNPRLIYRIELHRLSRKERKMTCHQNPGPGHDEHLVVTSRITSMFYYRLQGGSIVEK